MENERKKKFQDYAPPEQKPSGGYNLNGVYYSRDGQRLDDQPKKSWSQREYERAEREKIHCRAKREQGESEVDAQGNPIKDNSGVKKAIAIVVIVLGVIASIALPGSATWAVICNCYTYQRQKTKAELRCRGLGTFPHKCQKSNEVALGNTGVVLCGCGCNLRNRGNIFKVRQRYCGSDS